MQQVFLAVYFAGIPALCTFALYKFARIWLWAAPIIATLLGTVMMTVYLGGLPVPTDERWLTFWEVLMPVQQLIAISICLGALVGLRWGGSLGPCHRRHRDSAGADGGGSYRQRPAYLSSLPAALWGGAAPQLHRQGPEGLGGIPPGE